MIGQREVHSADGLDHILHVEEHRWFVVWRGERKTPYHPSRRLARIRIREMKKTRPPKPWTQLRLPF